MITKYRDGHLNRYLLTQLMKDSFLGDQFTSSVLFLHCDLLLPTLPVAIVYPGWGEFFVTHFIHFTHFTDFIIRGITGTLSGPNLLR